MTDNDRLYIQRLLGKKLIKGPVLELGGGYGGETCKQLIIASELEYYTTDVLLSSGVDYVANFESSNILDHFPADIRFKTVLILNVLEHTFDPIRVLDNASKLLCGGGSLVVITPCLWPLHDYPIDCYRILPNFYETFAHSRRMHLDKEHFEYLGYGTIASNMNERFEYRFPLPCNGPTY